MILGLGVDVVCVSRLEADMKNRPTDFENTFTPDEVRVCCESGLEKYRRFASRLAAKEAFVKCLGFLDQHYPEIDKAFDNFRPFFGQIEVVQGRRGRPEIKLHGALEQWYQKVPDIKCWVSLSHEADNAVAMVIFER